MRPYVAFHVELWDYLGGILIEYHVWDTEKCSTQALKSWSSYFSGEADKAFKGELKRKCRIIVNKCQVSGLDEKVLYMEHFHVLHGLLAVHWFQQYLMSSCFVSSTVEGSQGKLMTSSSYSVLPLSCLLTLLLSIKTKRGGIIMAYPLIEQSVFCWSPSSVFSWAEAWLMILVLAGQETG